MHRSDENDEKKNKQDIKEDGLHHVLAHCSTPMLLSLKYWKEMGYFHPSSHTLVPTAAPKGAESRNPISAHWEQKERKDRDEPGECGSEKKKGY